MVRAFREIVKPPGTEGVNATGARSAGSSRPRLAYEPLVSPGDVGYLAAMRRIVLVATVTVLGLAVPATAAAPPEVVKLRKQVATLSAKVKQLTVQRNAARREVAVLKAQLAPKPTGSVAIANGENGDRARVTGANVTASGDILGQIEYLGGLTCPNLGPYLQLEATFFNAAGQVIDTGGDLQTSPVAGVHYPINVLGASGGVRADAVVSVTCL